MIIKKVEYHDSSTGEILREEESKIEDLSVRFKIGSGKGQKASRFSKIFQMEDPNFEVGSYYQYFFKCLLHLEMSTNRIVTFTNGYGNPNTPLNENDFVKLFKTSKKTVKNFLNYCKEKDIVAKVSKNDELFGYIINPIFALNGSKITSMLYVMFRSSGLDDHIPKQDLSKLHEYLKVTPREEENIFLKN